MSSSTSKYIFNSNEQSISHKEADRLSHSSQIAPQLRTWRQAASQCPRPIVWNAIVQAYLRVPRRPHAALLFTSRYTNATNGTGCVYEELRVLPHYPLVSGRLTYKRCFLETKMIFSNRFSLELRSIVIFRMKKIIGFTMPRQKNRYYGLLINIQPNMLKRKPQWRAHHRPVNTKRSNLRF